ncbi:MAG: peptidase T [Culicoidibacterales bacterium]
MERVESRFMRYVKVNTVSDASNMATPSTVIQFDLARMLLAELHGLGILNATMDEFGYVMAKLVSNSRKQIPAIGFMAHMDTSPDFLGENVKPQVVRDYDGGDIRLNDENMLSPVDFPSLLDYVGKTLITTDGTTLLGADDKAGIAEIMAAVEYLVNHPEIEHGDICIGFNPDEEIGRGVVKFDVEKFGAAFAYTLDGGAIGCMEYENFNAAAMKLVVHGRMVHPGDSKGKMVNAAEVAIAFHNALPKFERPEYTAGYEGFYHLTDFTGGVELATANYIIRDHSDELYAEKKRYAHAIVAQLEEAYPIAKISLEVSDTYLNMKRQIEPVFHIIDLAQKAMESVGITPIITPIRGGTDGSNLSYMGLPCPNLFAGGHNAHGRFEYVVVESMEAAVEVVLAIVQLSVDLA